MQETGGAAKVRWGTAVALTLAVLFLSAFDAVPLVTLPLAMLLLALPSPDRGRLALLALPLGFLGVALAGGPLGGFSRAWALMLAGGFVLVTLWRPHWRVLPRGMVAVAVALLASAAWITLAGQWRELDGMLREHLLAMSTAAFQQVRTQSPESGELVQQFTEAVRQVALLQWRLFPGLLGLQSLAALALASWVAARLWRVDEGPLALGPLRDFRFNDQLVWILILGLVLLVLPLGALASRLGQNALLFMGGLYALRGVGVFAFFAAGAPSALLVVAGAFAAIFLYPIVLTAAVLVGLGDTWLDVRGRATLAPRP